MSRLGPSFLLCAIIGCGTSSSGTPGTSDAGPPDADHADGAAADAPEPPIVYGKANGQLAEWNTLAPMPTKRANFCAVAVGSWVVVIGGNYKNGTDFTKLDDVHVAKFHEDGTLDSWKTAGKAPSPVTECTVASTGSTLLLLDGIYDDDTKGGHVFRTTLSDAGDLATWEDATTLPSGMRLLDDYAWATATQVLALHSNLDGTTATLHAPVSALTPWSDAVWLSEFRGRPQWASAAGYAYVLGGYSDADAGNVVLSDTRGAKVNDDGTMGASFAATALPQPTTFGSGVGVDDYVFVFGGRDAIFTGTGRSTVWSAHAAADGTLGAWAQQSTLPAGLSNFVVVSAGNYVYALGGAAAAAVDTVYAARARY